MMCKYFGIQRNAEKSSTKRRKMEKKSLLKRRKVERRGADWRQLKSDIDETKPADSGYEGNLKKKIENKKISAD